MDYLRTRKSAVVLTLILLIIGSVLYFTTEVADRNNKIMYEESYDTSMNVVKDYINTTNRNYDDEKMVIVNKKAIL